MFDYRRARKQPPDDEDLTEAEVLSAAAPGDEGGVALGDVVQLYFRHSGMDWGELVSLRVLSLSHNELADIRPVADLPVLADLNVNHNRICDLSPVLLAANNRVASLEGPGLKVLRRLSLFSNELSDLDALVLHLASLPALRSLDLGGNPCFQDASQRYGLVRAVPQLAELDGERLGAVDRQLASEFFECAQEVGFQERPLTAQRPKTSPPALAPQAPAAAGAAGAFPGLTALPVWRPDGSPATTGSSAPPASPRRSPELEPPQLPDEDGGDPAESVARLTRVVEAYRLRLHTIQVDCENLRQQARDASSAEPEMGAACLRERIAELEEENRRMHEAVAENARLRALVEEKEAEAAARRLAAGLPEAPSRPGTAAGARPGTASGARRGE
ncbi:unnamed protein product [Prorocentrum cordatum]|uniref:Leucine-rich repeat-containing protein 51 n=1 Tax=Prorocentrum cordatum TaxID=2364126 RepID=A0ABN9XXN7_9DINO|nr:unnamed protein product [Polarella glacialis]